MNVSVVLDRLRMPVRMLKFAVILSGAKFGMLKLGQVMRMVARRLGNLSLGMMARLCLLVHVMMRCNRLRAQQLLRGALLSFRQGPMALGC